MHLFYYKIISKIIVQYKNNLKINIIHMCGYVEGENISHSIFDGFFNNISITDYYVDK